MNKCELDRLEWCYREIYRYKAAAERLQDELQETKKELAKISLNKAFGSVNATYGISPGNDEVRKEGES